MVSAVGASAANLTAAHTANAVDVPQREQRAVRETQERSGPARHVAESLRSGAPTQGPADQYPLRIRTLVADLDEAKAAASGGFTPAPLSAPSRGVLLHLVT